MGILYNGDDVIDFLKNKQIYCFGVGKKFEDAVTLLENNCLCKNIVGVIDNDKKKAGSCIEIDGKTYIIQRFHSTIKKISEDKNSVIVITTKKYKLIEEEINEVKELSDSHYIIALYHFQKRVKIYGYQSNLYPQYAVGQHGERMTISILTHNRVELSVRLIDSIEDKLKGYRGKVLIGDNYSDSRELEILTKRLERSSLAWKLVSFDEHYPIPIGKNKINEMIETEWIMQLDNDMYFISNPIDKINEDICVLGCPIWGLPYYNTDGAGVVNYGSNLEFLKQKNDCIKLEYRMDMLLEEGLEWAPMLCTYSSGGASLIKKELYTNLGGYDNNMFVFEDVEFIYRVNMIGYKIGNIGMCCLVHDHKKLDSTNGKKYERIRHSKEREQASRDYFKKMYGFMLA